MNPISAQYQLIQRYHRTHGWLTLDQAAHEWVGRFAALYRDQVRRGAGL